MLTETKCKCQLCNKTIEFDGTGFEKGETRTVECPHCHCETLIFVPPTEALPSFSGEAPHSDSISVRGTILDFTVQTNRGIISGDDNQRYLFQGGEWKETGNFPAKGQRVDFSPREGFATEIYLIQDTGGGASNAPASRRPYFAPKKGVLQFQNPENGFIEEVANAPLWVLLFGGIYFAVKGVWTHAVAGILAAFCTCGLSWLIYPFFADQIMRTHYLRKGWLLCSDQKDPTPRELIEKVITIPPRKRFVWLYIVFGALMIGLFVSAAGRISTQLIGAVGFIVFVGVLIKVFPRK